MLNQNSEKFWQDFFSLEFLIQEEPFLSFTVIFKRHFEIENYRTKCTNSPIICSFGPYILR
jgi:hypothetical protein